MDITTVMDITSVTSETPLYCVTTTQCSGDRVYAMKKRRGVFSHSHFPLPTKSTSLPLRRVTTKTSLTSYSKVQYSDSTVTVQWPSMTFERRNCKLHRRNVIPTITVLPLLSGFLCYWIQWIGGVTTANLPELRFSQIKAVLLRLSRLLWCLLLSPIVPYHISYHAPYRVS